MVVCEEEVAIDESHCCLQLKLIEDFCQNLSKNGHSVIQRRWPLFGLTKHSVELRRVLVSDPIHLSSIHTYLHTVLEFTYLPTYILTQFIVLPTDSVSSYLVCLIAMTCPPCEKMAIT